MEWETARLQEFMMSKQTKEQVHKNRIVRLQKNTGPNEETPIEAAEHQSDKVKETHQETDRSRKEMQV
jgi:hypothetical protein